MYASMQTLFILCNIDRTGIGAFRAFCGEAAAEHVGSPGNAGCAFGEVQSSGVGLNLCSAWKSGSDSLRAVDKISLQHTPLPGVGLGMHNLRKAAPFLILGCHEGVLSLRDVCLLRKTTFGVSYSDRLSQDIGGASGVCASTTRWTTSMFPVRPSRFRKVGGVRCLSMIINDFLSRWRQSLLFVAGIRSALGFGAAAAGNGGDRYEAGSDSIAYSWAWGRDACIVCF